MKLCYQVATPDVEIAESVTAYQGSLEKSFGDLSELGYDGVELMTKDPSRLDWNEVKTIARQTGLFIGLVCTGEIFGQLHVSFTDPRASARNLSIAKVKEIIDFASFLGAKINIGRIRGQYYPGEIPAEQTEEWLISSLMELSDYAKPKNVDIALETVTIMQTNLINTVQQAHELIQKVNRSNFRMMMDTFHLNIEEKNLPDAIRKYSCENIHVHLSDNNRRYPGNCGMDFEKVILTFHDMGYDDCFCTEIFQHPNMEEAAKRSIEHLAPIFYKIYGHKCGGLKVNAC